MKKDKEVIVDDQIYNVIMDIDFGEDNLSFNDRLNIILDEFQSLIEPDEWSDDPYLSEEENEKAYELFLKEKMNRLH